KRGITCLLNFRDQDAAAHGVDRPGRQEYAIARMRLELMQAISHLAGLKRDPQAGLVNAWEQAGKNTTARLGIHDKPSLGLAAFTGPELLDCLCVRMDLDGQPIAGIEKLHQP